jgi:quinol monooxygenase YgiN
MSHKLYKKSNGTQELILESETFEDVKAMANSFASDHVIGYITASPEEMVMFITPIEEWNANNG